MDVSDNRVRVQRILQLNAERKWDEWATLFHEDVVIEWPQSRERVEGRDNAVELHRHRPDGGATGTLLNVRGQGDVVISEARLDYPDGSTWHWASIFEFKDGKVARVTGYFGEPFVAAEWRAPWVTRM